MNENNWGHVMNLFDFHRYKHYKFLIDTLAEFLGRMSGLRLKRVAHEPPTMLLMMGCCFLNTKMAFIVEINSFMTDVQYT